MIAPKVLRRAYALLALLSVGCFGGPFLIGSTLRGGDHRGWPPDRPVEWVAAVGVSATVLVTFLLLGSIWVANYKELKSARRATLAARAAKDLGAGGEADRGSP